MHHFAYRDGVLHAEAVNLASLARRGRHAVLLLFDRHAGAALPRVCRRLRRRAVAGVLLGQGQFQPGGDRDLGEARRRRRRRLRRRAQARARGRRAARTRSCSPASARPRPSLRWRSTKTSSASTSSPSRSWSCCPPSPPARAAPRTSRCASIPTSMPRPTPRSRPAEPRTSSAFRSATRATIYAKAAKLPGLRVVGVDMHIGSQITELSPFDDAFALLSDFVRELRADGHTISHVDLGGGLGIPYRDDNEPPPDPSAYAEVVKRATRGLDCKLIFEPGRLIVGNAGILVTRVLYLKRGEAKTFVIVDAAMNDLIRPTLYEAHPRNPAGGRSRSGRAPDLGGRGRPGVRIGRFPGAGPGYGRTQAGRSPGGDDRRRLWGGPGRHLQHPPADPGSACPG